ncbi:hypothetical protein JYT22_01175, partial [Endomicrobium sp. AH-315-J14]|nr:hypothetical protein [Endomicrobium sp. AH-315-J14]
GDMSAAEHRKTATDEEAEASVHESQFDPTAASVPQYRGETKPWISYNPTEAHRSSAAKHRQHARDHQSAAALLEKFEEKECKSFTAETRKLCPLLGTVEEVEDIDGGVRLKVAASLDTQALFDHVRCHLAFAAKHGREGMSRCPLYLENVRADAPADSHVLELTTEDRASIKQLREKVREHVTP